MDSTALRFRGGEVGQRVNSRFCPAATSVSQTESAILFRLPLFFFFFFSPITLICPSLSFSLPSQTCTCSRNCVGCGKCMLVLVSFKAFSHVGFIVCLDTGSSSSSEDEGPRRQNRGAGARNGEIRRRRSHSPASPRRRHRDASPR